MWPESKYDDDIIIGVIDTGIWPERLSFSDRGLGPIPKRWKGVCQEGTNFTAAHCNRKLIGARYVLREGLRGGEYCQCRRGGLQIATRFRRPWYTLRFDCRGVVGIPCKQFGEFDRNRQRHGAKSTDRLIQGFVGGR